MTQASKSKSETGFETPTIKTVRICNLFETASSMFFLSLKSIITNKATDRLARFASVFLFVSVSGKQARKPSIIGVVLLCISPGQQHPPSVPIRKLFRNGFPDTQTLRELGFKTLHYAQIPNVFPHCRAQGSVIQGSFLFFQRSCIHQQIINQSKGND